MIRSLVGVALLLFPLSLSAALSWELRSPAAAQIFDLALVPATSIVFAATNAGVFHSTDDGDTWARITDIPVGEMSQVEVGPAETRHVYAAGYEGFYRSVDGGTRWSRLSGLPDAYIQNIEIDSVNPAILYASVQGPSRGVYKSVDHGSSWSALTPSLPTRILIADSGVVYAGTSGAVYGSWDQGARWTLLFAPGVHVSDFFAASGTLWGRFSPGEAIRKSTDGGLTWSVVPHPAPGATMMSLAWDPASRVTYIGTSSHGVFSRGDGEVGWTAVGAIDDNDVVSVLALRPSGGLFAGTDAHGVLHAPTRDNWLKKPARPIEAAVVRAVTLHPTRPSAMYAATSAGVFRSTDGGRTYTSLGLTHAEVYGLAVREDGIVAATNGHGVYLSRDDGSTWEQPAVGKDAGLIRSLVTDVGDSRRIAIATYFGVFLSMDGGRTWSHSLPHLRASSVLFDPARPRTILVSTHDRIWRSTDDGATWEKWSDGPIDPFVTAFFAHPAHPDRIYASTLGGLTVSTDGGVTWSSVDIAVKEVRGFALADDGSIWAATLRWGLFRSVDGGNHWDRVARPTAGVALTSIAVEHHPSNGVWLGSSAGLLRSVTTTRRRAIRQ